MKHILSHNPSTTEVELGIVSDVLFIKKVMKTSEDKHSESIGRLIKNFHNKWKWFDSKYGCTMVFDYLLILKHLSNHLPLKEEHVFCSVGDGMELKDVEY